MAAQYLKQEPAILSPRPPPAQRRLRPQCQPCPPTPTTVAAVPPVAPPPTETRCVPRVEPAPRRDDTELRRRRTTEPVVEEPPPPRIVQREGIVRGTTSIQAPSKFVLISPDNGKTIDYLYTTSTEPGSAPLQGPAHHRDGRGRPGRALGEHAGPHDPDDPGRGVMPPANLIDGRAIAAATPGRTGPAHRGAEGARRSAGPGFRARGRRPGFQGLCRPEGEDLRRAGHFFRDARSARSHERSRTCSRCWPG